MSTALSIPFENTSPGFAAHGIAAANLFFELQLNSKTCFHTYQRCLLTWLTHPFVDPRSASYLLINCILYVYLHLNLHSP